MVCSRREGRGGGVAGGGPGYSGILETRETFTGGTFGVRNSL